MDWVHRRIKEIQDAGMAIDWDIANKYLLAEMEPATGLKQVVKVIEMDALDVDFEMPERGERMP